MTSSPPKLRNRHRSVHVMRSQDGDLQPMRVIVICRLRTAADHRPPAPAPLKIRGNENHAQSHVCCRTRRCIDRSAAAIRLVGGRTAAGSRAKMPRRKRTQARDRSQRANGRRNAESNGKKQRLQTKLRKAPRGQNSGAPATNVLSPPPNSAANFKASRALQRPSTKS